MKALFIGSYPNPVEPFRSVFFRELIYEMAKQGIECTVISCVSITAYRSKIFQIPEYSVETLENGVKIEVYRPHIITYSAKKIGKWNTMSLTQKSIESKVLKLVKKINKTFDFVYGHFFLGGGLTAAKVGQKFKIPAYIAYGECNFETEVSNKYIIKKEEMKGVRGIVAVSSYNKKDIEKREFSKDIPVLLSNNSINEKVFHIKDKEKCREELGLSKNDFIVGFVGYFIERKGPERVLEACSSLEKVKLAFVGKGENRPEGENVIFCKSLSHEKIVDFLNAIDVFVLPTKNEGCCNAVIEAMACGKAIISSDLPFNHDILNNNNNAILINPMDINAIRQAVIKLRDNKELRKKIGIQALKDSSRLTISYRANNILEFIKSLN